MPYVIGQSEIFIAGVSVLIVVLLMIRFYIARHITRQAKETTMKDKQS